MTLLIEPHNYIVTLRKVYNHSHHQMVVFTATSESQALRHVEELTEYFGDLMADEVEWTGLQELV